MLQYDDSYADRWLYMWRGGLWPERKARGRGDRVETVMKHLQTIYSVEEWLLDGFAYQLGKMDSERVYGQGIYLFLSLFFTLHFPSPYNLLLSFSLYRLHSKCHRLILIYY